MTDTKKQPAQSNFPLYLSLALAAVVVASYFLIPGFNSFLKEAWNVLTSEDEAKIRDWINGFGWFGSIVLILAMVVQMFLIVIPTVLLMVVAIIAYGPVWGSLLLLVAIFAASTTGYWLGRYFGEIIILRFIGKSAEKKVTGFLEKYGFWAIFVTRINPFLSNDAVSFMGGVMQMNYWKFIGATIVGITPLIAFIAILGRDIESMKMNLLWGSLAALLIFGAYIWWDKRRK